MPIVNERHTKGAATKPGFPVLDVVKKRMDNAAT